MIGMRFAIPSLGCLLVLLSATLRGETVEYRGVYGSSIKIEGTSTVHDWEVLCKVLLGSMKMEGAFPTDLSVGEVPALASLPELRIQMRVRSIKSGKSDMDRVMHAAMKDREHPTISFVLTEMVPSRKERKPGSPLLYDTKGDLTVAGRKKGVVMPVEVVGNGEDGLRITGRTRVKMTDFGIDPPAPRIALGAISTGDPVDITFEWIARRVKKR